MKIGPYANVKPSEDNDRHYGASRPGKEMKPNTRRIFALAACDMMHPDGKAWKKCCHGDCDISPGQTINCAFVDRRLPVKSPRIGKNPFVCIHQEEDGFLRVCAGWHACYGKKEGGKK